MEAEKQREKPRRNAAEPEGALLEAPAVAISAPDQHDETQHTNDLVLPVAQAVACTAASPLLTSSSSAAVQNAFLEAVAGIPPARSNNYDANAGKAEASAAVSVRVAMDDTEAKKWEAEEEDGDHLQEAVAVPGAYATPNVDEEDRRAARLGTELGHLQAQQEVQDILRQNRDIPLRNFAEQQHNREVANPSARVQNYREETGMTQTSSTVPAETCAPTAPLNTKEPEFFMGTYGKDYEVSEYQTGDYETTEYETKPYKSVYDP